jgi:hypothetical protein
MQHSFKKRTLTLNKKTILRLNALHQKNLVIGGGTENCPFTYTYCPNDTSTDTCDPTNLTLTPATKCIGQTSAPITKC